MAERYNPFMTSEAKRRMAQIPPEFLAQLTPEQRARFVAATSPQRFNGTVKPPIQLMKPYTPSFTDRLRMGAGDAFGANSNRYRMAESLADLSPLPALDMLRDAQEQYVSGDYLGSALNTGLAIAGAPFGPASKIARSGGQQLSKVVRDGVGKSKNRVGTTGQYVGGPFGVDTPKKLRAMQDKYMEDVELGKAGADWYRDSSDFINQVALPNRRQGVADTLAVTSQSTGVDPNLGFTIKGINQRAAGLPVNTGRFPGSQSPLIEDVLSGQRGRLGPKREPFANNLSSSWNPALADTSVNDIWQGRSFGYTQPNGKPWDSGFSPQQHAFMDENMLVIADRLNAGQTAGRTDWDNLNTQAASWSGAKIRAGDITEADAAKSFGDFADKYAANATYEQAPGANTGQLEGILDRPFGERQAFEDVATWVNSQGIDDLYSSGGLLAQPTNPNVGSYTPASTGVLEINPGQVARPLVQQSDGAIIPSEANLLDIGESSRAYIDVQNAGAYHKIIPDNQTTAGERTSVGVALNDSPDQAKMAEAVALAEANGYFAVDTGFGVNFVNDIYSPIGANRTGADVGKSLKGDFGQQIERLFGVPGTRVKIQAGYEDFEEAWQAGQGSGAATRQFLDKLDENPTFAISIQPALQRKAAANIARDDAAGFPQRADVRNAREIFIKQGYEGLRAALKSGAVLPAIAAAVLSPLALQDSGGAQSGGSQSGI